MNPKDKIGSRKINFHLIPCEVLGEVSLAMLEGAKKYGQANWRKIGVQYSVYYDACLRHLMAWFEGEDIDPDSGLSHITKAIAGLIILRDSMFIGNAIDDRPPKLKEGWVKEMNKKAEEIINKHGSNIN